MIDYKHKIKESRLVKGLVYAIMGFFSYPGINIMNKLKIDGMEKLKNLPRTNVLFVSNHQTYFTDVITFIHIFCAASWGRKKSLGLPIYLLWPFIRVKYVAAATTMKSTLLTRFLTLAGAITVKRTWNSSSGEKIKGLEASDTRSIARALDNNWIITFPQGTTTPFAPGRKGTAFIIKHYRPIVVPIVIDGFSEAFCKNGLKLKKKKVLLSVRIKDQLDIDFDKSTDQILEQVMFAIEQSDEFEYSRKKTD